jgi:26S proteasome regulatory subunit T1
MGKDYLGKDQRSRDIVEDEKEEKEIKSLDEGDIKLLKSYGQGPYSKSLKQVETDIVDTIKRVNELAGIKVRIFLVLF